MTAPVQPVDLSDADLYESFRDRGLSHDDAVLHVERRRRARPQTKAPPQPQRPGMGKAAAINALQGFTSGFADELAGHTAATRGLVPPGLLPALPLVGQVAQMLSPAAAERYTAARDDFRQQRAEATLFNPGTSLVGTVAGAALNPAARFLGPITQGMGPAATTGTYGAVLGAAQGIGEGTTPADRAGKGAIGFVGGGVVGAAGGKILGPLRPLWRRVRGVFKRTDQAVARTLGKDAPRETVDQVREAAHRAYLTNQGYPPQVIDQLMATWRAGGKVPTRAPTPPPEPAPPVLRPGESLEPILPKLRANADPFEQPAYMRAGNPRGLPPVRGRGETLPYYPRGGRAEQSVAPYPAESPAIATTPNQIPIFAEYLKGATPEEIPERVGLLRALGIDLPPNAEAELLAYLSGAIR